jgi:hypothetical protein
MPSARPPNPPATGRHPHNAGRAHRPHGKPPVQRNEPPPAKPWGRMSFAAAKKPPNPTPSVPKRKRPA